MSGDVSTTGPLLRLTKFGAQQEIQGVSAKIYKDRPRYTIHHAFIGKVKSDQKEQQVYRRVWHDNRHEKSTATVYSAMMNQHGYAWSTRQNRWVAIKKMSQYIKEMEGYDSFYRWPVRALYGPRIQDHLTVPTIAAQLMKKAGERLIKNMTHEVDFMLTQLK